MKPFMVCLALFSWFAIGVRADSSALQTRLDSLNQDIVAHGIHSFPGTSDKLLTGYAYGEFYDWDLYFENVYLSYYGIDDYCFSNFKVFLSRQKGNGFVSRTLNEPRATQPFKPFLAQLAVLGSKQRGDYEWLRAEYYEQLKRFLANWSGYDHDHNGLPVWDSSDASGMDNQISRAGEIGSCQDEGVDLACFLYRELEAMQVIAEKLGKPDEAADFGRKAKGLAKQINSVFWDEKDGFYYDRNEKTGRTVRVKSVAGFTPLWAGLASPTQAARLVKHLTDPKEFWSNYPVASYAANEPDFYQGSQHGECNWRGPVWIPSNYVIFHGLVHYGFRDVAKKLADRTRELALSNPVTREYYDSDTGKGNGMNPFWGWSSLAYVMPLDFDENYDPTDLHGEIKPLLRDKLHIQFPARP
jgi:hypothetical protein